MKSLLHIGLFLLGLALLSSCAKDELESPTQSTAPSALIIHQPASSDLVSPSEGTVQNPAAEVNDDGDDETAGSGSEPKKSN